ncbi:MAG: hypothetical protein EZS28_010322 [Streblomastix strix]|uniref:Uncharacterized protein n=1 Tax=Streblomastix strix TaxID=222440 RepID=A0A5J4WGP9_9EUKA|nr:MAG: hypothetical protein EZS28_010322 [Streblomastix strix]
MNSTSNEQVQDDPLMNAYRMQMMNDYEQSRQTNQLQITSGSNSNIDSSAHFPNTPLSHNSDSSIADSLSVINEINANIFKMPIEHKDPIFREYISCRIVPLALLAAFSIRQRNLFINTPRTASALPRVLSTTLSAFAQQLQSPFVCSALGMQAEAIGLPFNQQSSQSSLSSQFTITQLPILRQQLTNDISTISALIRQLLSILQTPDTDFNLLLPPSMILSSECLTVCLENRLRIWKELEVLQWLDDSPQIIEQRRKQQMEMQRKRPLLSPLPSSTFCHEIVELVGQVLFNHFKSIPNEFLSHILRLLFEIIDPVPINPNSHTILDEVIQIRGQNIPNHQQGLYPLIPPTYANIAVTVLSSLQNLESKQFIYSSQLFFQQTNEGQTGVSILVQQAVNSILSLILIEGADQCRQNGIEQLHQLVVGVASSQSTSEQAAINWWAKIAVYQCLERLGLTSYATTYSQRLQMDVEQVYVPSSLDLPTFSKSVLALINDTRYHIRSLKP